MSNALSLSLLSAMAIEASNKAAAAAAGMEYHHNPFTPGQITPEMIAAQTAALASPGPKVAYCRSGNRSAGAYDTMTKEGLTNILHMNQGITAWQQAGLPLQK